MNFLRRSQIDMHLVVDGKYNIDTNDYFVKQDKNIVYSYHHSTMQQRGSQIKYRLVKELEMLVVEQNSAQKYLQELKNIKKFTKGQNFEAKLNHQNIPIGKALFYHSHHHQQSVFFGTIHPHTKQRTGQGIQMIIEYSDKNPELGTHQKRSEKKMTMYLLNDWDPNSKEVEGSLFQSSDQSSIKFEGKFEISNGKYRFKEGEYSHYKKQKCVFTYKGSFKNNEFNGQGKLTYHGKHEYIGSFEKNRRWGYGQQRDFFHKTVYRGEFEMNNRQGYGELSYHNSGIVLKGFWKDGNMESKEGVFIDYQGLPIELYEDH